jgi:hypothetical protein
MIIARDVDGLPVDRIKITSPFDARLKYNLYAALTILPRHQHRHLWQAERVYALRQRVFIGKDSTDRRD